MATVRGEDQVDGQAGRVPQRSPGETGRLCRGRGFSGRGEDDPVAQVALGHVDRERRGVEAGVWPDVPEQCGQLIVDHGVGGAVREPQRVRGGVGDLDLRVVGQRMVLCQLDPDAHTPQQEPAHPAARLFAAGDAGIDAAVGDRGGDLRCRHRGRADLEPGAAAHQPVHQGRCCLGPGAEAVSDAQRAAFAGRGAPGGVPGPVQRRERGRGGLGQGRTGRGQRDTTCVADQQGRTEVGFQSADPGAECGLGDADACGRAGEVQLLCQDQEVAQADRVRRHVPSLPIDADRCRRMPIDNEAF
ncbi:hypothetical protein BKM31_19220 [[Actinomadura] parvosata subsp. kistnae]|uniref:Uncharacterized protein n=1 Tax=[Actinomadura] parvosata subsp. kistnae TaxID=1909395 RepID=A0A1U9ZZF7_9ACTN|nr:hypothetical protein BKM31_19220 [Nonomuraea sp. ATCC 55076]